MVWRLLRGCKADRCCNRELQQKTRPALAPEIFDNIIGSWKGWLGSRREQLCQ